MKEPTKGLAGSLGTRSAKSWLCEGAASLPLPGSCSCVHIRSRIFRSSLLSFPLSSVSLFPSPQTCCGLPPLFCPLPRGPALSPAGGEGKAGWAAEGRHGQLWALRGLGAAPSSSGHLWALRELGAAPGTPSSSGQLWALRAAPGAPGSSGHSGHSEQLRALRAAPGAPCSSSCSVQLRAAREAAGPRGGGVGQRCRARPPRPAGTRHRAGAAAGHGQRPRALVWHFGKTGQKSLKKQLVVLARGCVKHMGVTLPA